MNRVLRNFVQRLLDFGLSLDPGFTEVLRSCDGVRVGLRLLNDHANTNDAPDARLRGPNTPTVWQTIGVEIRDGCFVIHHEDSPTEHDTDVEVSADEFDIEIEGTPGDMLRQLVERSSGSEALVSGLKVKGSLSTLSQLQEAATKYQPKLEAGLSGPLGDVAAHRIGNGVERSFHWARESLSSLRQDALEYLLWEGEFIVDQGIANEHYDAVDVLREDFDRLNQRVELLAARLSTQKPLKA